MTFGWDALGTKRSGMIHMYIHENCPNNNAFAVYVKSSSSSGKEAFTLRRRVPAVWILDITATFRHEVERPWMTRTLFGVMLFSRLDAAKS